MYADHLLRQAPLTSLPDTLKLHVSILPSPLPSFEHSSLLSACCSPLPFLPLCIASFSSFSFHHHPTSILLPTLCLTSAHSPTWMTCWASPGSKRAMPTTTIKAPTVLAWPLGKSSPCPLPRPPSQHTCRWASPRSDSSPHQPHPAPSLHHSLTVITLPASPPLLHHRKRRTLTTSSARSCLPLVRTLLQESPRVLTPCRWMRDVGTTSSNSPTLGDH